MARIPDSKVARIKAEVSLVRLVEASGVVLSRKGKDELLGCCPFHEDGTPSLSVSVSKNLFHCFGCGAAGGVIDWVMRAEGMSFAHAVEWLRADAPGGAPVAPGPENARPRASGRRLAARPSPGPTALLRPSPVRIAADFAACGVVGEETNALTGYLACVSRLLDRPLALIIQSSSAAGKSSLMDAVLGLMPPTAQVRYSAMTGQSLFYMGETNLKHRILAIAEEEGACHASYALKLLQSEGEVTIASTGKDATTGNLVTQEYRVEGPVMLFLTTTAIDIDEELMNRCLVLSVDESREQTRAIHAAQRRRQTLAGLLASEDRAATLALHRNAQSLLEPMRVVNPFADDLTFLDDKTRTRRDHMKYLTLIQAIALLHQHQRPTHEVQHRGKPVRYIEVVEGDIALANRLAAEVLGRKLDELPPQTRRLLGMVHRWVREECAAQAIRRHELRFTRRQLRAVTGWGDTQLKVHLGRLVELEYLIAHRGAPGPTGGVGGFHYELLYDGASDGDGDAGAPFLMGLSAASQGETCVYDPVRSGSKRDRSAFGRASVAPWSGGGRDGKTAAEGRKSIPSRTPEPKAPKTHLLEKNGSVAPYMQVAADNALSAAVPPAGA